MSERPVAARKSGFDDRKRDGYNRLASEYDRRRFTSPGKKLYADVEEQLVKSLVCPKKGMKVLDVAGGTGRIGIPLALGGASLVIVDISENMLREAAKKATNAGVANLALQVASARAMPFRDDAFDIVTSFKFFHLIPNDEKQRFMDEMIRVLKPGGLLVAQFNSPFYGFVLPLLRYQVFRQAKGSIRTSCIWPRQVRQLFGKLEVQRKVGVVIPFAGAIAGLTSPVLVLQISKALCRVFPLNYLLSRYLVIVARKPISY